MAIRPYLMGVSWRAIFALQRSINMYLSAPPNGSLSGEPKWIQLVRTGLKCPNG